MWSYENFCTQIIIRGLLVEWGTFNIFDWSGRTHRNHCWRRLWNTWIIVSYICLFALEVNLKALCVLIDAIMFVEFLLRLLIAITFTKCDNCHFPILDATPRTAIHHITMRSIIAIIMSRHQSFPVGTTIRLVMMESMLYQFICSLNIRQSFIWTR